jgi:transposase
MRSGRPKTFQITLTHAQREELEVFSRSRSLPHGLVRRANIILLAGQGLSNTAIAAQLGVSNPTVAHWCKRYLAHGIDGLYDLPSGGRPRTYNDDTVAHLMQRALDERPADGTHWSVRSFAEASGLSKSTVQRYFKLFGIQPHRTRSFKLSTDPFFIEKVRDIVGLYLNPPDHALVLCVDEKSQVQALERSQPVLPMGLGYVEGVTHDYFRHGTTTLFAALDIANGTVLGKCKTRHRHQEFLSFLRHIERNVPENLDVHLVMDNYATHKHPRVRAWFAKRPRFHVHFTPTYASWLNQVERWFGLITQRAIKRGSFKSVKDLTCRIERFIERYNQRAVPFAWTATPESIFEKLQRLSKLLCGTAH